MSRNAPPKETAAHNRTTFLSIVAVVWLRSVEKTNRITAKCEWRKLSRERACGANNEAFLAFVSRRTHATKNGLYSRTTIVTGGKKICEWKPKYRCFMCSSLCSGNERIYIFWKCLILSVNQGLKASYRLKAGEKSNIQNSLSTN